ncbi:MULTISPECIES: imidazole glycerol phosphate synthase subunit HisF [unclassified Pseudoclavibacter]|uniref:imidazole glycerol phosphate synthase subunit HisF n=1 Tax=unclassified Pseudoclavibacter TaxID=2615177 RepID=UPI001301517E|nr:MULTISPECIES: imidazole glycerol phosphate synthase subunit HisF [unclassified Pseudoclavibacter]KAB1646399.1 imidazole glycerol phosphate synthase subunit HisF [Pseudoclavibacter sp. CFCC 14310]KAB1663441.1 imidazole glycerol phosphate synthase subunit HisF [Pseudoclavibacter sp. CFCC 13611]
MTLAIRVIPCLDVADGRVVKGVNFRNLRDEGDPVELAARYYREGADEVTFLDVTATVENRATMYDVVQRTAEQVFIPLTVGGGVRGVDQVARLLASGADKIGINSAAIARPEVLTEIADRFGAQVTVLSLDIKRSPRTASGFVVTTHGGRTETDVDALEWAQRAVDLGAGELLVNSIDADGTQNGFDLDLIARLRGLVAAPIIASGGAGTVAHFVEAARAGADAVLAASVFHRQQVAIPDVKQALADAGFEVRAVPDAHDGLGTTDFSVTEATQAAAASQNQE